MEDVPLIHDPQLVEKEARMKENETRDFLLNLKKEYRSHQIDSVVHQLNSEVSAAIDCLACANCCNKLNPAFTDKEIENIALDKKISARQFIENYLDYNETENYGVMKFRPCKFLADKKCTIYSIRPESCREYPHLSRPNFIYRNRSTMHNYKMCPIVFNVVEKLKRKLPLKVME